MHRAAIPLSIHFTYVSTIQIEIAANNSTQLSNFLNKAQNITPFGFNIDIAQQ
jgi:hypothetical protein